jgi:hypothetical protein
VPFQGSPDFVEEFSHLSTFIIYIFSQHISKFVGAIVDTKLPRFVQKIKAAELLHLAWRWIS